MADAEIAIVDVAPAGRALLERQGVDNIGHDPVAEPDAVEKRRALPVEEAAIVGRQADGDFPLVDRTAETVNCRPIGCQGLGERIVLVFAAAHIAANLVAQRVIVVALVADGQQVAVFGIEDEEKPVEQE